MLAWQFTEVGTGLSLHDVGEPVIRPDSVIIDVRAAGLCHSDVSFLDGTLTNALGFRPITLGHEIAGTVAAVGASVCDFAVGDRVVVPANPLGPGTKSDGGFASKVAAPESLVLALPDNVPWAQAAVASDAGMTSYKAVIRSGRVEAGLKVGLIGLGGLGSLGAQAAIAIGAEVYVAETKPEVHAFARELGATAVASSIRDFDDIDLDVIIDFAGFGATTADAIDVVRSHGRVVVVGMARSESTISTQRLVRNEIQVLGSLAGSKQDCADVLDLVAAGKLTSRVTTISFDEIGEGIGMLERGEVIGRLVALT